MKTTTKPMNVSLTDRLDGFVRKLVKSGRYNSASEVVRDGIRLVEEREQLREIKLQALKQAIQNGRTSGTSTPFDADDIIKRGKERLKSRNAIE